MTGGLDSSALAKAAEMGGVGTWVLDLHNHLFEGSDAAGQWLGQVDKRGPASLEELEQFIHPDDRNEAAVWFGAVSEVSEPGPIDYRLKTGSGWRWVQSRIQVLSYDDFEKPLKALVVSRDVTQIKILQQALLEAEARWTSLVDEAPVGISLVGTEGQLLFVNRLEASNHESPVVGRQWKEFLPPELHKALDSVLGAALLSGAPAALETYRTANDGSVRYFENHLSPVRGGSTASVMVISLDVTQEHLTRRRQRKEARRNEILLSMHTSLFEGRETIFRVACLAARELTDAKKSFLFRVNGVSLACDLVAASDETSDYEDGLDWVVQTWVAQTNSFSSDSGTARMAIPFRSAELPSVVVLVERSGPPFLADDAKEVQELLTGLWQLILRKEQTITLEQLSQAIECTPASILVVDRKGEILYANSRFLELAGFSAGPLGPVNLWALQGDLMPEQSYQEIRQAIQNDTGWQGELPFRKPDGTVISELVTVSPVRIGPITVSRFVVVKEDITERKTAQELVFQARKMETLAQVAAGVAHDFNNLLASILAYNEMILRRSDQPDNVRRYSQKISQAGERASKLVVGMLAAGQRQVLETRTLELGEFLAGEEPLLSSLARPYFSFDKRSLPAVLVDIDPIQMGQVVLNLVANALDAVKEKGSSIVLSYGLSDSSDRSAWFRVQDDGPGIPEDVRQRIFEPFFTTKRLGKGTGLGLAMVQGIIQQHRGLLTVDSQTGVGTQFTVTLPIQADLTAIGQ